MKEILEKVKKFSEQLATSLDMEIVSVNYVREFGMNILRIIARKEPIMSIDDASELNRLISDELDKYDLIAEDYYLEVSSEGIEKELETDIEINQSVGKHVCIRLYQKLNGKKEFFGDVTKITDTEITLDVEGREIIIERKKIAKIRLAVKF